MCELELNCLSAILVAVFYVVCHDLVKFVSMCIVFYYA